MRTLKRRESTIKHLKPTSTVGGMGSVTVTWAGTPAEVSAVVQPMDEASMRSITGTEYGITPDKMRAVYLPNGTYADGDGIWLSGESTALPPWLIVSVAAWHDLTRLYIKKVL